MYEDFSKLQILILQIHIAESTVAEAWGLFFINIKTILPINNHTNQYFIVAAHQFSRKADFGLKYKINIRKFENKLLFS